MHRLLILACVCVCRAACGADIVMTTEKWANNDAAFEKFRERIAKTHLRNLLARRGVRVADASQVGDVAALADGEAGVRGGEGRVPISGAPSVITFYLGRPKTVTEVGVYTLNIDARANQDYEVRFADNSQHPGKKPKFPDKPDLTTGDKVIGPNAGGFHSAFRRKDGGPLVPRKVDWVQFRVWRTYNVKAGSPAKERNRAHSWTSAIEFEVLGTPDDVLKLTPEEKARIEAIRRAPKRPRYEKKATWQETYLATREAIVKWEILQDVLALPDCGVEFGPWYVLGPLASNDPAVKQIEGARRIKFSQPLKTKDGKTVSWRKLEGVKDGELIDLSKRFAAAAGDTVFLCRDAEFLRGFDRRHPLPFSVGLYGGYVRWLPSRRTWWPAKPFAEAYPNQYVWKWQSRSARRAQVLVRAPRPARGRWAVWFLPMSPTTRPGGGSFNARIARREWRLYAWLRRDFKDPVSLQQMKWEQLDSIGIRVVRRRMSRFEKYLTDWRPGAPDVLSQRYLFQIQRRAQALQEDWRSHPLADRVAACAGALLKRGERGDFRARRAAYYALATIQEALAQDHRAESMRLAVEDQRDTFGSRYPEAAENLARAAALERRARGALRRTLETQGQDLRDVLDLRSEIDRTSQDVLLDNPLLKLGKLLVVTGGMRFAANWSGPNRLGNKIQILWPIAPDGELKTIYNGTVSSMELSWDARRILFSDGRRIFEVGIDGKNLRQISPDNPEVAYYDPCRLPNGKIVFVSTACEQAVPCTGQAGVGNLHIMDADGSHERRLAYDQDHNWNPVVMNDGSVLYTRWEYQDTPHYFSRLLFQMYPDGTEQREYYGSNSYWPNAMFWPRPIPGHPSEVVCIVSGHHGVAREGELVLLDPALGRHEADGVVQRIPGRGKKVEPVIMDGLVSEVWPRFAMPWPLADPVDYAGAGKYFLVDMRPDRFSPWGLYLVDVFDNLTLIKTGTFAQPIQVIPRRKPPVLQRRVDLRRRTGRVYLSDVYEGRGLRGYPKGSIVALRVSSAEYRFPGNGDTRAASYEGCWDVKKILGTVPVYPDGSALFEVPANTPITVMPLDAQGQAQQQMRSWFVVMPGERASCVGCHEPQNQVPPKPLAEAMRHPPAKLRPWFGPARGFSFDREVQPVLDRRCAGCHDGRPGRPDFRAKRLHSGFKGHYSPAYMALQMFVRRAGYEADYHLLAPAEFAADTSQLVQMLKKGHHNVRLTPEEWRRLYAWIDLNVPYAGCWRESHRPPRDDQVARRVKYMKLFAGIDDRDEEPRPLPPIAKFEPPPAEKTSPAAPVAAPGWPFDAKQAARKQKTCGLKPLTFDLGGGVKMTLVPVPAGEFVMGDPKGFPDERPCARVRIAKPFWMGRYEVTNEQYARFDPSHDSGYMEGRFKDRFTRGTPVNGPKQPVIRVTWNEAMAFCRWLSQKTGANVTLPTEAQWEWACRAGSAGPFSFGARKPGRNSLGNFADAALIRWNYGRGESDYLDGASFSCDVGRYPPNAWGLYDMHGNVAEWTRTTYRPYPYRGDDGRNAPDSRAYKVVRGGSWNDLFRYSRSASRWRYRAYQPVYNVGFRIVCLQPPK